MNIPVNKEKKFKILKGETTIPEQLDLYYDDTKAAQQATLL